MGRRKRKPKAYADIHDLFVRNLSYYIEKAQLTDQKLSEKMRCRGEVDNTYDPSYINQICKGDHLPTLEALTDIADGLNIHICALLYPNLPSSADDEKQVLWNTYFSGQSVEHLKLLSRISQEIHAYEDKQNTDEKVG